MPLGCINHAPSLCPPLQVFLLKTDNADLTAFEYMDGTSGPSKVIVKWGDLHGRELTLQNDNKPSDKALGFHAKRAFDHAVEERWIDKHSLPSLYMGDRQLMKQFLLDSMNSTSDEPSASSLSGSTDRTDLEY